ncbi:MAG: ATP-binding protein [Bacteroidales bacterium]|nr:ATP-binding protein [Bacteroidales bacterium]
MDKQILENILSDQREELELKKKLKFCKRKEEDNIDLHSPQAQVVIGVRRSGKSTLCFNALIRNGIAFAYVNFDDERLINLTADDLNDVLEVLYKIYGDFKYLFIDEIQNISEWYLFVNRLLRRQMHIIITGSNAKLLSGELATHLTGRHNSISLYPFSFAEYCDMRGVDMNSKTTLGIATIRNAFDEYMRQGGFPELQFIKNDKRYINELVNNILKRDIEQRFKVAYTSAFEEMAQHLLNISPAIISHKSLNETFNIRSIHTSKNYVNYLKQAYLLIGLHKYSAKSRLRIVDEKLYPVDVALMNKREDALAGENLGWRLESIVYLELIRRFKDKGKDIYYFRDRSGECDFIICDGRNPILAIQVSYDISSPVTKKREIAGLVLTAKKIRCDRLLLLTHHDYDNIEHNGYNIAIRPVYSWATEQSEEL